MINLITFASAEVLIESASVSSTDHGAQFQFTCVLDDVDVAYAELTERGVTILTGPMDRPRGIGTASFADTDRHIFEAPH